VVSPGNSVGLPDFVLLRATRLHRRLAPSEPHNSVTFAGRLVLLFARVEVGASARKYGANRTAEWLASASLGDGIGRADLRSILEFVDDVLIHPVAH